MVEKSKEIFERIKKKKPWAITNTQYKIRDDYWYAVDYSKLPKFAVIQWGFKDYYSYIRWKWVQKTYGVLGDVQGKDIPRDKHTIFIKSETLPHIRFNHGGHRRLRKYHRSIKNNSRMRTAMFCLAVTKGDLEYYLLTRWLHPIEDYLIKLDADQIILGFFKLKANERHKIARSTGIKPSTITRYIRAPELYAAGLINIRCLYSIPGQKTIAEITRG